MSDDPRFEIVRRAWIAAVPAATRFLAGWETTLRADDFARGFLAMYDAVRALERGPSVRETSE